MTLARLVTQRSGPSADHAPVLLLALWFGLATGLAEVGIITLKRAFFHAMVFVGPDVVWMAPLADALMFLSVALVLAGLGSRWPRMASVPVTVAVFPFLAYASLLVMVPRLHRLAALLLAAGLAVRTAPVLTGRWQGFVGIVRRTKGWLIATVVALAVGLHGGRLVSERSAVASLPPAPRGLPNVLLVVLDTVRAQSLAAYGYGRPNTPELERLARAGVRFERALATAPWTLPSHASLFTGRLAHELSTGWRVPLDATYPTLAESLARHGYLTAGFVANTLYCSANFGLDRGFVHYEDYGISLGQVVRGSALGRLVASNERLRDLIGVHQLLGRKPAAQVNGDFLRWLDRREPGRPFFAFLNYYDAHTPYLPPAEFAQKFSPVIPRGYFHEGARLAPEVIDELRDAYDGAIAYLDYELGRLLADLRERGLLDDTLLIVTSDHGESFGEHGLMAHGNSLYLNLLHVPLVIVNPARVPTGRSIAEPVSLRDIPATVVDLIGLDGEIGFPGKSLSRHWADPLPVTTLSGDVLLAEVEQSRGQPKWYPVMKGSMRSLVSRGMHYIRNDGDGREEIYDIDGDPWEKSDLSGSERGRRLIGQFRQRLPPRRP
jgi:arylsulfatase A-like enzyme